MCRLVCVLERIWYSIQQNDYVYTADILGDVVKGGRIGRRSASVSVYIAIMSATKYILCILC